MLLATFLHISDLHLGDIDPKTLSAVAPPIWAKHTIFDGLHGHSFRSLVRLDQFLARLTSSDLVEFRMITTGDLTTWAADSQFITAREFLGRDLRPPKHYYQYLGLHQRDWMSWAIPGNHDHWSGKPQIVGGPTSTFFKYFGGLPLINSLTVASGHRLTFLRIDTDADVKPFGSNRLFARGCFTSQLESLGNKLTPLGDHEIRVLLLHHSLGAPSRTLAITSLSRRALEKFIVEHGVSVLLCGHLHQPPFLAIRTATHLKQQRIFLEACCGTTTQTSTLPPSWKNIFGQSPERPNRWPNSLMVHRLLQESNGSLTWLSRTYLETPRGFTDFGTLPNGISNSLNFTIS